MKYSFPRLALEFRVSGVLEQFGSIFGTPFRNSVALLSHVLSIKVAVTSSMVFPDSIFFD